MLRRIAVVGDQLDTGGHVVHYEDRMCTCADGGHQVALIGGAAYCEQCKSIGAIAKTGGPRRVNFMGETAAHGDVVLCNCATPPRIIATLAGESWCDDGAPDAPPFPARVSESVIRPHTLHDEQFALTDSTGRPLVGVRYRVRLNEATIASGVTDASGKTQRISIDGMKRLYFDVAQSLGDGEYSDRQ